MIVDILAATLIITALVLFPLTLAVYLKTRKQLQDSRKYAFSLGFQVLELKAARVAYQARQKELLKHNKALADDLAQCAAWAAELFVAQEETKRDPLGSLSDERLQQVIRDELVKRVSGRLYTSEKPHQIASRVGGIAFRVVDAAKRGTL